MAQVAPRTSAPVNPVQASSMKSPVPAGRNLNLASTQSSVSAARAGTIVIGGLVGANGQISGGTLRTIVPGDLVTPAMNAALWQVVSAGAQHLLVNSAGVATGGAARLNASWSGSVSELVVPAGVTIGAIGFNAGQPLNVGGPINILGSLYALQNSAGQTAVLNTGDNLTIGSGGVLSGNLPAQITGLNLSGLFPSQHMNLNVAGKLSNSGTISVPGNLNINVGGSLSNSTPVGTTSGAAGTASILAQNINIISASGTIVNSGLLSATNSININTAQPTTDLIINNTGGVMQALGSVNSLSGNLEGGIINLREDGPNIEAANTGVWGGTLSAPGGINMYGKEMVAVVDRIDGPLSNKGSVAHVSVKSGELVLGKQLLSGDPTYYNNGGDIQIANVMTVDGDLAIVASGDIITTGDTTIQTVSSDYSIFLGAGLNFKAAPSNNSIGSFSDDDPGDEVNTLTFSWNQNGGKNINSAGNALNLTTTGSGSITAIATGSIDLGSGSINSGDGNVLLVNGTGFKASGSISTGAGNVSIRSSHLSATWLADLSITNGTPSSVSPVYSDDLNGDIALPAISSTGSLHVNTYGSITLNQNINIGGGNMALLNAGGDVSGAGVVVADMVSVHASSGKIGASGSPLLTQTANLILNAGGGDIFASNEGSMALTVTALGNATINNTGNVMIATPCSASGYLNITTSADAGGNGQMLIGANINAHEINLKSTSKSTGLGGIQNTGKGGILTATIGTLQDTGSSTASGARDLGSSGSPISCRIGTLSVPSSKAANIWLTGDQDVTFDAISSTGSISLALTGTGNNITVGSLISAPTNVTLTAGSGGTLTLPVTSAIKTTSLGYNTITLNADNQDLRGSIDAGGFGVASFQATSDSSPLAVTSSASASIKAGYLTIFGNNTSYKGNVTFNGELTTTGTIYMYSMGDSSTITNNGNITAGSFHIFTYGSIANSASASIDAGSITLVAYGALGSSTAPFKTSSVSVNANANGDVWLANTGSASITSTSESGTLTISNVGDLTLTASTRGSITVNNTGNVTLHSVTSSGSKNINVTTTADAFGNGQILIDDVMAYNTITLVSTSSGTGLGGIQNVSSSSKLSGAVVMDLSDTGTSTAANAHDIGSSGMPVNTEAWLLVAKTSGSIFANNKGSDANASLSSTSGSVSFSNTGSVTLKDVGAGKWTNSAATTYTVTTTADTSGNGQILIGGNITAGSTITLSSTSSTAGSGNGVGGIQYTSPGGLLTAAAVDLSAIGFSTASGANDIGSSAHTITTAAGALKANATGNIVLSNSGNVDFSGKSGQGALSLSNTGNVSLTGNVAGNTGVNIFLAAAGAGHTLDLGGNQILSNNTTINITADSVVLSGSNPINAGVGTIVIVPVVASTAILLGGAGSGLNFTTAQLNTITAGTLMIGSRTCTGGITVSAPLALSSGYDLQLFQGASSFNASGQPISLASGGLLVSLDSGNISVDSISVKSTSAAVLLQTSGAGSSITLGNGVPTGHRISLLADTGTIKGLTSITPGRSAGGDGGNVLLSASNLTSFMNLVFDASGSGTGSGGYVSFVNTGTAAFNPTTNNLLINVSGANAGSVIISSGGNLSLNWANGVVKAAATGNGTGLGVGAHIELIAGNQLSASGVLSISGSLSAAGSGIHGIGGSITLSSRSSSPFVIGGAAAGSNGITGTLDVSGVGGANGSIAVLNRGGGITDNYQSLTDVDTVVFDTSDAAAGPINIGKPIGQYGTSTISLIAGGSGAINPGSNLLTANDIGLFSGTGAISAKVCASNIQAITDGTAAVSIENSRVGVTTLGASSSGASFSLTSLNGNIVVSNAINSGKDITLKTVLANSSIQLSDSLTATNGIISLTATGSGTITSTGLSTIEAKTVSLITGNSYGNAVGTAGNALRVNTSSLAVNSTGDVNINNLGGSTLTITAATSTSSFALVTAGALVFTPSLSGASIVSLTAPSGITVTGSLGNTNTTTAVQLTTSGSGNISGAGTLITSGTGSVTLAMGSGNLGSATTPLKINTTNLDVSMSGTAGLINVSNAWASGPVKFGIAAVATGAVTLVSAAPAQFTDVISGSSVTIKSVGANSFGGAITASTGAVSITESGSGDSTFAGNISAGTSVSITAVGAASLQTVTASNGAINITTKGTTTISKLTGSGAVTVTQTGGGLLTMGASLAGTTLSITTSGLGITTTGPVSAATSVTLKNTGVAGGIIVGANLSSATLVTLTASGTGTISDAGSGSYVVQAPSVVLNTGSSAGSGIGASWRPNDALRVNTSGLAANSTGLININNLGTVALTLTGANCNNQLFQLFSASPVVITPTLANASQIYVDASSGTGGITLNGTALGGTTNTSLVALFTSSGAISSKSATLCTNAGGRVELMSTSGSFGSATALLKINTPAFVPSTTSGNIFVSDVKTGSTAGTVTVQGLSTTGSVSFTSAAPTTFGSISGSSITLSTAGATTFSGNITASGAVSFTETGTATTIFNLSSTGTRTISGSSVTIMTPGNTSFAAGTNITTSNGAISITESTGLLSLGQYSVLSATGGGITLLEKGNTTSSGINIGYSSSLSTSVGPKMGSTFPLPGQISVVIGSSVPTAPVRNSAGKPANVSVNEGASPNYVYWGSNASKIDTTAAGVNNMTVTGNSAIVFSAGSSAKITLGGSTTFVADPPAISPALTVATVRNDAQPAITRLSEVAPTASTIGGSAATPLVDHSVGAYLGQVDGMAAAISGWTRSDNLNTMVVAHSAAAATGLSSQVDAGACKAPLHRCGEDATFKSGTAVLAPAEDTTVKTVFGRVDIKAGAIVLLVADSKAISVYNLDDQRINSVAIYTGERTLTLSPGQHAVITERGSGDFARVNPLEAIAYRRISQIEIGNGLKAFTTEFSIPSALAAVSSLKTMVQSNEPAALKRNKHLLKTVAAIMQVKARSENYQRVGPIAQTCN